MISLPLTALLRELTLSARVVDRGSLSFRGPASITPCSLRRVVILKHGSPEAALLVSGLQHAASIIHKIMTCVSIFRNVPTDVAYLRTHLEKEEES